MSRQLQQHEETVEKSSWLRRRFGRKPISENAETVAKAASETVSDEVKITELQQIVRQRQKNLRIARIAQTIAFLGVPFSLLIPLLSLFSSPGFPFDSLDGLFLYFAGGVYLMGSIVGIIYLFCGLRRLKQATTALADTEDIHAVGPLIEALRLETHVTAAVALNRLLPHLQAEDAGLLDDKQRGDLYRALRASANPRSLKLYNPAFAVTVLRALERIGDEKAIPILERLIRSAKDAPIRSAAEECLPFLKARLECADDLPSFGTKTRAQAGIESASQHGKTESVDALMEQFRQAARARKRNTWIAGFGIGIGLVIMLSDAFTSSFLAVTPSNGFGFIFSGELIFTASAFFLRYTASRTRGVANALANTDDLRVVGPLAESLGVLDPYAQAMAVNALTRLLPRLRASDAGLLNDNQRSYLYRRLAGVKLHKRDRQVADFTIVILKALEQIGDARALSAVESLVNMEAETPEQKRVQKAAWECLPFLQARAEHQHAAETLLRASGEAQTPPEVLLRPAVGTTTADTETLLRPGVLPEKEEKQG